MKNKEIYKFIHVNTVAPFTWMEVSRENSFGY